MCVCVCIEGGGKGEEGIVRCVGIYLYSLHMYQECCLKIVLMSYGKRVLFTRLCSEMLPKIVV